VLYKVLLLSAHYLNYSRFNYLPTNIMYDLLDESYDTYFGVLALAAELKRFRMWCGGDQNLV